MKEKKLKSSPIVLGLYVVAALMAVYAIYQIISTTAAISSYYSQYDAAPKASEIITYILQAIVDPLTTGILLFGAGYILNEVRALNPKNYIIVEKPVLAEGEVEETKKGILGAFAKKTTEEKPAEKPVEEKPAAKKSTTTKKPAAKKPAAKKATTTKKTTTK